MPIVAKHLNTLPDCRTRMDNLSEHLLEMFEEAGHLTPAIEAKIRGIALNRTHFVENEARYRKDLPDEKLIIYKQELYFHSKNIREVFDAQRTLEKEPDYDGTMYQTRTWVNERKFIFQQRQTSVPNAA